MFYQDKTIVVIGNIDFLSRTLFVLGCVIQKRSLAADSDGVLDLTLQYILSHYIFLRFRRISSKVWNEKNCNQNCPCQLLLSRGVYYEGKLGRLRRVFCSYVEWSTELTDINWFRYLFFFCSDSNNNSATPLLQFGRPLWPASTTALKFENHSIAMKTECSIHKKENIHYIHLWQSKTAF